MSGHSHWATTHRQKELDGAKRGNLYSKLSKAIQVAVKTGGGTTPESNFKLKVAIEKARAANLPKENVDRAIASATNAAASMDEATYEGFGPEGIAVIVDVVTDNKNRTVQEIKNIFERAGGNLAGPGAVSFNFDQKGLIVVKKQADAQDEMLKLIDLGVEDMEEEEGVINIYTAFDALSSTRNKLEENGFEIESFELIMKPKVYVKIEDSAKASKVLSFLDTLEEQEDVQKVHANLDVAENLEAGVTPSATNV